MRVNKLLSKPVEYMEVLDNYEDLVTGGVMPTPNDMARYLHVSVVQLNNFLNGPEYDNDDAEELRARMLSIFEQAYINHPKAEFLLKAIGWVSAEKRMEYDFKYWRVNKQLNTAQQFITVKAEDIKGLDDSTVLEYAINNKTEED